MKTQNPSSTGSQQANASTSSSNNTIYSPEQKTTNKTSTFGGGGAIFSWGRQREGQCGVSISSKEEKGEQQQQTSWPKKTEVNSLCFRQADAGGTRTVAVSSENKLYCWGTGHYGELGLAYQESAFVPTLIDLVPEDVLWKQVTCGYHFTIALTEDGDLFSWGANDCGQLGLGHTKMVDRPTKITTLQKITKVKAGYSHVIALNAFGEIFTWGSNHSGQLGRKKVENFAVPGRLVHENVSFRYVECNENASAAISNKGELFTWGAGGNGKLGHGNTRIYDEPELVKEVKDIPFLQVSMGPHHTLAITETKQVYAWGVGHHGELGTGSRRRQLKPVPLNIREKMSYVLATEEVSFALSPGGALYSWGNCNGGLLGNGRKVGHVLTPTKISTDIEFSSLSASRRHVIAIGKGNGIPPYETWREEDEEVDPNATKKYLDDPLNPEKYLYPLYFPPPSKDRKKPTAAQTAGEEGAVGGAAEPPLPKHTSVEED